MFISFFLIVGAIVNAHIFGSLAVLISQMNEKGAKFQEKLDTAKTAMKNLKIPQDTQNKVIQYLLKT